MHDMCDANMCKYVRCDILALPLINHEVVQTTYLLVQTTYLLYLMLWFNTRKKVKERQWMEKRECR